MTFASRQQIADRIAAGLGHSFEGEIRIGGHYASAVRDGRTVYLSGQVPRVGTSVIVAGKAGDDVSLEQARLAAQVCALRALAILRQELGSLDAVEKVLRVTVYVQSAPGFTQHSEVADAASDLLHEVFGAAGIHTRTSVGVNSLPKNATVELDMIVATSAP